MTSAPAPENSPTTASDPALQALYADTYSELRRLAHARLRKSARGPILDTTSLVHESYVRLAQRAGKNVPDREYFIQYAASVMRSVVVDFIRETRSQSRGGDAVHVTLTTQLGLKVDDNHCEALEVHEALAEVAKIDARLVKVVELRYFAGMTDKEVAEALGVTDRTVRRDWEKARLLLAEALG